MRALTGVSENKDSRPFVSISFPRTGVETKSCVSSPKLKSSASWCGTSTETSSEREEKAIVGMGSSLGFLEYEKSSTIESGCVRAARFLQSDNIGG